MVNVLIGYSGAQENASEKLAFKKTLFFTLGDCGRDSDNCGIPFFVDILVF